VTVIVIVTGRVTVIVIVRVVVRVIVVVTVIVVVRVIMIASTYYLTTTHHLPIPHYSTTYHLTTYTTLTTHYLPQALRLFTQSLIIFMKEPRKRDHRQRAHSNPFSDHYITYPISPEAYGRKVDMVDIGCGYGGLLFELSAKFPDKTILGMEIRTKLVDYVQQKIEYLRSLHHASSNAPIETPSNCGSNVTKEITEKVRDTAQEEGPSNMPNTTTRSITSDSGVSDDQRYAQIGEKAGAERKALDTSAFSNIHVVKTNSMKFLPNYLPKTSIEKMFILFPDPHFKKKKHKARIISPFMLDIYHYVLKDNGLLYISTDVEELFIYMVECIGSNPMFARVPQHVEEKDSLFNVIVETTEESRKAEMKRSRKFRAIFQKRDLNSATGQ